VILPSAYLQGPYLQGPYLQGPYLQGPHLGGRDLGGRPRRSEMLNGVYPAELFSKLLYKEFDRLEIWENKQF
jgi:hypothetical protein